MSCLLLSASCLLFCVICEICGCPLYCPLFPIEEREPKSAEFIRRVLNQLSHGTATPDEFTPELQAGMFPGRAKQIGETLGSLTLPVAIIHLSELVERRDENGLRIYRYLLTDIGKTLSCTVKLTKEDKIAGIELRQLESQSDS